MDFLFLHFFTFLGVTILSIESKHQDTRGGSCHDEYSYNYCQRMAIRGECSSNPTYMSHHCRKACNWCPETGGTPHRQESPDCLANSNYKNVKVLAKSYCHPLDNFWYYLHQLTKYTNLAHCAREASEYLRDYFNLHTPDLSSCTCSVQHTSHVILSYSANTQWCRENEPNYKYIYDTTFTYSQSSAKNRICLTHTQGEFFVEPVGRRCSCQIDHGSHPSTSNHQSTRDRCMQYTEYQYFDNLLGHDNCISHNEATYGHFTSIPSNCTCSSHFDTLNYTSQGYWQHCRHEPHYYSLTHRLLGSSHHVCSTHHTIWKELSNVPYTVDSAYSVCQKDVVSQFASAVSGTSHNPCTCMPRLAAGTSSSVVTDSPSTVPASSVLDVRMCDSVALTVGLTFGDTLPFSTGSACTDGIHALSEVTPVKLCNATDSSTWIKGQQVIGHCDSLPLYSAVAAFPGPIYTHDGLAGVLLGCKNSSIQIASEDCTHGLSVYNISRGGRDSYIHSAENYFTISW